MKIAIRALTIASAAIWIFFAAFSVTLIYSAGAIKVETSNFETRLDANRMMLFLKIQMLIDNGGLYDLNDMEIKIELYDWYESLLAENITFVEIIPHGSKVLLTSSLTADLSDHSELIAGSSNPLLLRYEIKLNYADILPIKINGNTTFTLQGGGA